MRILVVCLGNICRSPAAEAILRALLAKAGIEDVVVESCALGHWHDGRHHDERMIRVARNRGWKIDGFAKGPSEGLFDTYDLVLAADRSVQRELFEWSAMPAHRAKVRLLGDYCRETPGADIPDPFTGIDQDFERSLDMIEDACYGLLDSISKHGEP